MFNWFKNKVELKNTNSIMSSFYHKKGLKIGSDIIVPQNFEALIYHNGKHYHSLPSGKYTLDTKTFQPLIERQQKLKPKTKYIKFVCHYINILPQKMETRYKKQKFIIDFCIENSINFAELLLLYAYKVDRDYAYYTLNNIFNELITFYKGDYSQIKSDSLKIYGITINSFLPSDHKASIFNTSSKDTNLTENTYKSLDGLSDGSIQNNISCKQANNTSTQSVPTTIKTETTQNIVNNPNQNPTEFPVCPKCKHLAKFNVTYCLKCGYKLQ